MIERLFRFQASSDYDSYTVHYTWHKKRRAIRELFLKALGACRNPEPTVVDIGCDDGYDLFMLSRMPEAQRCTRFVGVDRTGTSIEYCRARAQFEGAAKLEFIERDVVESPLAAGEAGDIALCSEIVEHLAEPDAFIRQLAEALPPGGQLILTTPNGASWLARIRRARGAAPTPPSAEGRHLGHVSVRGRKEWRAICRQAGLVLVAERRGSAIYGSPRLDGHRILAGMAVAADAVCDALRLNDLSWETLQLHRKPG